MDKKPAHAKRASKQKESQGQSLYTPGPWEVDHDERAKMPMVTGPVKENGRRDKVALFPIMMPNETAEANARLIAAAPELLAACQRLLRHAGIADASPEDIDAEDHQAESDARKAIRKATSVGRGNEKV